MHRVEAARVLQEVLGGDEAGRDRRHLELELDQLRIEQVEQQVVGPLAIDHRELEALVVQALLHAGLRRHGGDLVVFVRRLLHLVERRVVTAVPFTQGCGDHLRDADFFRPLDALLLALPQLTHGEVRTLGFHAMIGQDLPDFFPVRERREVVAVTDRRTQLEPRHADLGHHLDERRKVLEHRTQGIDLASNRQAQRIRSKLRRIRDQEPGHAGTAAALSINSRLDIAAMKSLPRVDRVRTESRLAPTVPQLAGV